MFAPDVVALRQFYNAALGRAAGALMGEALQKIWGDARGETLLGIGYCAPFLEAYAKGGARCMIAMPGHQGAAYWPPSGENRVFLTQEWELPLADNSVNRILLLHSVEHSEHLPRMMEEVWRVLTPGGRVLAIVPNRLSLWARASKSPFGYGRPFSMMQLRDLLTAHQFTLTRSSSALFTPPLGFGLLWRAARKMETLGGWICPFFGGVLLQEAEKQLYAAIRQPVMVARRRMVPVGAV